MKQHLRQVGMRLAHQDILNPDASPADMIEIEPTNGLLIAVRSAAGEFFYWNGKLSESPDDSKILGRMQKARGDMARLSKMAIDAGLAERQVQLQERMAEILARFALELADRMHLTSKQERLFAKNVEGAVLALEATTADTLPRSARPTQPLRNYRIADVVEVDS